jgi:hypothetical protein
LRTIVGPAPLHSPSTPSSRTTVTAQLMGPCAAGARRVVSAEP